MMTLWKTYIFLKSFESAKYDVHKISDLSSYTYNQLVQFLSLSRVSVSRDY